MITLLNPTNIETARLVTIVIWHRVENPLSNLPKFEKAYEYLLDVQDLVGDTDEGILENVFNTNNTIYGHLSNWNASLHMPDGTYDYELAEVNELFKTRSLSVNDVVEVQYPEVEHFGPIARFKNGIVYRVAGVGFEPVSLREIHGLVTASKEEVSA